MTGFDYAVILIVGVSIIISLMRGAIKELLSIVAWVLAFYVAQNYASQLIPLLPERIPEGMLQTITAFVILFLAVLLIASLISMAISTLFGMVGLGWLNRLLGTVFGFARGLLIVGVMVLLAGMTELPKESFWTNAMLSPPLEAMVKSVLPYLPEAIAQYVDFES